MNFANYKWCTLAWSATALLALAPASVQAVEPGGPVEIYVGASPGGGYDRMARAIETVLEGQKLVQVPINISYHPGGGGAVAWASINRQTGDMTKLSIFSPNIITNDVLGASPQTFEDFTILSTLVVEDGCFAVNPKGRINSAEALVDALKASPEELRFGFAVAAGNQWHVAMAVLAEAIGADITKVRATVFDSGGKAVAALLGEHTDVSISGCASFAKHHEAGDLKIIAIAADERLEGALADVPTWKEQGADVVWAAPRGLLAPKGLSDEEVAYWEEKSREVVKSDAWAPVAESNFWRTRFLDSKQSAEALANDRERYRKTLKQLGLIE